MHAKNILAMVYLIECGENNHAIAKKAPAVYFEDRHVPNGKVDGVTTISSGC